MRQSSRKEWEETIDSKSIQYKPPPKPFVKPFVKPIQQVQKQTSKVSAQSSEYDEDEFESITLSKSVLDEIQCFSCKQKFLKSEVASHRETCGKKPVKAVSNAATTDLHSDRQYSPIKETKKEDSNESDYTSVQESESLSMS